MAIMRRLVHLCSIRRLTAGMGVKKTYTTQASGVPCLIQPLDAESAIAAGMAFGRAFRGWFMIDAIISEGDKITDHQGRNMTVRGVRLRDYGTAANQHKDVLLEQDAAN